MIAKPIKSTFKTPKTAADVDEIGKAIFGEAKWAKHRASLDRQNGRTAKRRKASAPEKDGEQ